MTSLFLSYSSRDRAVAKQLHQRLLAEGYQALFLDFDPSQGIPAGRRWEPELYTQLRRTDGVIFLASADSVASQWCFAELSLARSLGRMVVPLRLDGHARLPLLDDVQWIDLAGGEDAFAGLVERLRRVGMNPADSFAWDPTRSPYPGLASFDRQDAAVYFGREKETTRLVELLHPTLQRDRGQFVAVIGPSGSGKSSLLRAGLLPRLERHPERWVVLPALVPGRQPVRSLAHSLARAFGAADWKGRMAGIEARLAYGAAALAELACELGETGETGRSVLVVIDQAEELLTRSGAREQQAFLALLSGALRTDSPLWVVATMRSEFLSTAPDRAGLAEVVDDVLLVEPLSRARLSEVIQRPARRAGFDFAAGLVEHMVEETTGGDALPLLACTLRQLYERASPGRSVSIADYEAVGGVVGSLQRQVDRIADELHRRGQGSWVVPTLLKLASVRDEGEPTRRRVRLDTLGPEESAVTRAFVEARLLTSSGGIGQDATVEVAHEALLRQWTPLREAIEASRRSLRMRGDVERLANDWNRVDRDESYLLRGGRLVAFEEWADQHLTDLGELDRAFLQASQALARRELDTALDAKRVAISRSLLFQAESLRTSRAGMSLLLGIAAMRVNPSPEARDSLVTTLFGNHYLATVTDHNSEVSAVAFSPCGRTMATGSHEPPVILWDVTDPARPRRLSTLGAHTGAVWALTFSPDGHTIATGSTDSTIILWDVTDLSEPRWLSTLDGELSWVRAAAFSPDGNFLLTGHWDNTGPSDDKAIIWDVSDRAHPRCSSTLVGQPNPTGPVRAVAFCNGGRTVATGNDDGTLLLWDIADPANPRQLPPVAGHANSVWALAASPDGSTLITGGSDQTAIVWDVSEPSRPARLSTLTGHTGTVKAVAFGPDGHTVVTGSWDHTAILWRVDDPSRPVRLDTLGGHNQPVHAIAFSPAGRTVSTASDDQTAVLWDTATAAYPARLARLAGHTDGVPALVFSPDGCTLASASEDRTAILWDVADPAHPRKLATLVGHRHTVFAVAFSPDGCTLLTGSWDGTAALWDVADRANPRRLSTLAGHHRGVSSVSFAPDGLAVGLGGNDGTTSLWDVADRAGPQRLATLTGQRWPVRGVPFSPDGRTLVTSSTDCTSIVWDVTDRSAPRRLASVTDDNSVYAAVFSPDGRTVALAEEGRKTTLWDMSDPSNPQRLVTVRGQASSVYTVGFSPDGKMIGTGGYDKTVILWDVTDRRRPRELVKLAGHARGVGSVVFSPDRRTLAISGDDSPVLLDVTRLSDIVTRPVEVACAITGRGLSPQEWERYAPDLPYQRTC